MQRRKFSGEFKIEAVRLVRDGGASVAQASRDIATQTIDFDLVGFCWP